jgi:HD-GYP domain-containing protein (c-di-GMP phosphodiesterase class II)
MNVLQKRVMVFSIIVVILAAGGLVVMAQANNMESQQQTQPSAPSIDPESDEFENFIEAMGEVQSIQEEMSVRVDELITNAPMDEDRFMEIHQRTQFGSESMDLSSSEEEQYETLASEINSAQQGYQEDMIEVIEDHDLTVDRFNAIVYSVQQNAELREALNDSL